MSTDFLEENLPSVIGDILLIQLNAFSPCSHLLKRLSRGPTLRNPHLLWRRRRCYVVEEKSMHFGQAGLGSGADCHFVVLWLWTSYLSSLSLSFPIFKVWMSFCLDLVCKYPWMLPGLICSFPTSFGFRLQVGHASRWVSTFLLSSRTFQLNCSCCKSGDIFFVCYDHKGDCQSFAAHHLPFRKRDRTQESNDATIQFCWWPAAVLTQRPESQRCVMMDALGGMKEPGWSLPGFFWSLGIWSVCVCSEGRCYYSFHGVRGHFLSC